MRDVIEVFILLFWAYTLWWGFIKCEPTPFANEVERWLKNQPVRRWTKGRGA